jgi:hypothetical protein
MWKANGKTATLQLFLNSLSPKNMRDSSSGDKLKIALFGGLSLEEAMDLSRDRRILELESFHPHYGPGVDSASNRNEYQESSWGKGRPVRGADNLTAICELIV